MNAFTYDIAKMLKEVDASLEDRHELLPRYASCVPPISLAQAKPICPDDIVRMRIPVSYVTVKGVSKDFGEFYKTECVSMTDEILKHFVRVWGDSVAGYSVGIHEVRERTEHMALSASDTKHVLWYFVEAARLGDMTVEGKCNPVPEASLIWFVDEVVIFVECPVCLGGSIPTGVLHPAHLRHE